jgi:hypothetical protein
MKVSTPPAYTKMFPIYTGTALNQYALPAHRGLFIAASAANLTNGFTGTNIDGTTLGIPIAVGGVVLPLVLKDITTTQAVATIRIHGLL